MVTALRDTLNLFARRFALALQQSTRMRLGGAWAQPDEADPAALRASGAHLPGTGWIVGLAACLSFALLALALRGSPWGPATAAVGSTIVTLLMTGGRAESSLFAVAELWDEAPAGARGTMALVLLLLAKVMLLASLATISEASVMAALFAAHVVSLAAPPVLLQRLEGASDLRTWRIAALWSLVPLLLMIPAGGPAFLLLPLLASLLAGYGMLRFAQRTGSRQAVPASQPVCELAFYLGAALGA